MMFSLAKINKDYQWGGRANKSSHSKQYIDLRDRFKTNDVMLKSTTHPIIKSSQLQVKPIIQYFVQLLLKSIVLFFNIELVIHNQIWKKYTNILWPKGGKGFSHLNFQLKTVSIGFNAILAEVLVDFEIGEYIVYSNKHIQREVIVVSTKYNRIQS